MYVSFLHAYRRACERSFYELLKQARCHSESQEILINKGDWKAKAGRGRASEVVWPSGLKETVSSLNIAQTKSGGKYHTNRLKERLTTSVQVGFENMNTKTDLLVKKGNAWNFVDSVKELPPVIKVKKKWMPSEILSLNG